MASIWGIFVEMQDLPKDEMKSVGFLLIFQAAIMIMALKYEYILNRCFDYFGFEIDVTLRRIIILGACLVITCTPLTIYVGTQVSNHNILLNFSNLVMSSVHSYLLNPMTFQYLNPWTGFVFMHVTHKEYIARHH